eukprot:2433198-Amphidinium_carterae.1
MQHSQHPPLFLELCQHRSIVVCAHGAQATLDCATNALMLLLVLSTVAQNTGMMRPGVLEN